MRRRNDLWQGGNWQDCFIQQSFLCLGYAAWGGYLNHGRGLLVCEITDVIPASMNWQIEPLGFMHQFIPHAQTVAYLQKVVPEGEAIASLEGAIATYDPTREIILLIQGNGAVEVHWLRPKILLQDCYGQVWRRWTEFYLEKPTSGGLNEGAEPIA